MMNDEVCVISYNSRGFDDCKKDFVKDLLNIIGWQSREFHLEEKRLYGQANSSKTQDCFQRNH